MSKVAEFFYSRRVFHLVTRVVAASSSFGTARAACTVQPFCLLCHDQYCCTGKAGGSIAVMGLCADLKRDSQLAAVDLGTLLGSPASPRVEPHRSPVLVWALSLCPMHEYRPKSPEPRALYCLYLVPRALYSRTLQILWYSSSGSSSCLPLSTLCPGVSV